MRKILTIILLFLCVAVQARIRYVSTRGNDLNTGIDTSSAGAWRTWSKGFSEAMPGDTIYFMGGVYLSPQKIILNPIQRTGWDNGVGHSGTAENPIMYASYPGQWAIFDCIQHCDNVVPSGNPYYNSAIEIYFVRNIHFKDFEVRNVFQCDSVLNGAITAFHSCYLTFEHIVLHDVSQRAWQVEGGAFQTFYDDGYMDWTDETPYWNFDVDTIRWINCDTYNVCDSLSTEIGNGGDVFHTSMYPENVMIWEGCRLWNYSDDGFNAAGGGGGVRIINNCWMMPTNKYYWTDGVFETERNGVKAGWNSHPITDAPYLWPFPTTHNTLQISNSLVMFGEIAFREGPNNIGYYHNNTVYKCGLGFESTMEPTVQYPQRPSYKNNLIHKMTKDNAYGLPYMTWLYGTIPYDESNNSWVRTGSEPYFQVNTAFTVTDDDFVGLDGDDSADSIYLASLFLAPRQVDGSLPATKPLTLAEGSDLIDAGTRYIAVDAQNVNLTLSPSQYAGAAPDIGYDEYGVQEEQEPITTGILKHNNYTVRHGDFIVSIGLGATGVDTEPELPQTQIIADHTVVDKFDDIPQIWIDEVKKMFVTVSGQSHAEAYYTGVQMLELIDPKFAVNVTYSGTPEAYTTSHLRLSGAMWGDRENSSGWVYGYDTWDWAGGEPFAYTYSPTQAARVNAGISYAHNNGLSKSAMAYGYCYNEGYIDSYITAQQAFIDYCTTQGLPTVVFFTTGPVDGHLGLADSESYLSALRWQTIRNYVAADETRVLFDYADILSYSDAGVQETRTYNGLTYGVIHPENATGDITCYPCAAGHIGGNGALKIGKALWWMLARMAGWDGLPE